MKKNNNILVISNLGVEWQRKFMKLKRSFWLRMNKLQRTILISSIFVFFLFLASCSYNKKNDPVVTSGTPVKIANPTVTSLTDYMRFNANTTFLKKEIIRSTFQGFIQKVFKNIGDNVRTGDLIFQIITKEAYATDSMKIKLGDENFRGSVLIKAKSNGILTETNYNIGDFVLDGEQLAVISNPSSLAVLLNVPYQHVTKIKIGSGCILILPNGQKLNETITKALPSVDLISQTQTFLVEFSDLKNLPANLNIEIKIPKNIVKNVTVLPRTAIQSNETLDNFWIMKMINDSTAIKIPITKGIENDSLVQIIQPDLQINDRIIVDGAYGLLDTAKVVITR